MADKKTDADQDKPAPKAKAKPNLFENKAIVLGVIVVAQAVVAIGLTQFVIVPRLQGGHGGEAAVAGAEHGGGIPAEKVEGKHGGEKKAEKKEKKEKKAEKKGEGGEEGGGTLVDLQEIVVTLAGDSARPRYLRLGVNIETADEEIKMELEEKRPQLRDAVIMALSDKTAAMLSTPEGKKRLREEIYSRASELSPEGGVLNVFFTDLVVQ